MSGPNAVLEDPVVTPLTDLAELQDKGHHIVECLAGDAEATDPLRRLVQRLKDEKKETFHSDLLFYLTSERFPEAQAASLWAAILEHKLRINERLERNVGVRVAALDYVINVQQLSHAPRVVKSSVFSQTVRLARTDSLTGLFNRRYFIDQANRILEAANRQKTPVVLLMTDLDQFKPFNDTHGHQAGDLLLQEAARIMRGCVRASDFVARYGGDEFAVFLPKANKPEALPLAEKIRAQIEENCRAMGVTVSLGLAQYPEDAPTRDDLIDAADEVLYRAKEFGGNQVCYFHPVLFRYIPADAGMVQGVSVVGDFNNWNRETHPLARMSNSQEWAATLQLKPGRYRYKYLINNALWSTDPLAQQYENDGFGGRCSVLVVR